MDLKELGGKIRRLRAAKGFSQENVAADLGISITAYSKIERGQTNVQYTRITQIAEYFGVLLDELIVGGSLRKYSENVPVSTVKEDNDKILLLNSTVEQLKKENNQLKELLKAKDEIIHLLKNK